MAIIHLIRAMLSTSFVYLYKEIFHILWEFMILHVKYIIIYKLEAKENLIVV